MPHKRKRQFYNRMIACALALTMVLVCFVIPCDKVQAQTPSQVYTNLVIFADFTDTYEHNHSDSSFGACFAGNKGVEKTYELFNGTNRAGDLVDKRGLAAYVNQVSYGMCQVNNVFPQYDAVNDRMESYKLDNTAAYYAQNPQQLIEHLMVKLDADDSAKNVIGNTVLSHNTPSYIDNVMIVVGRGSSEPFGGVTYYSGGGSFTNSAGQAYHVGSFNIVTETQAYLGIEGSGLLIHEFMHSMGYPDLYCQGNSEYTPIPVGSWDIMASESMYVQYPLAYMRQHISGWLSLPTVTTNQTGYTLTAASATNENNKNSQAVILKTPYSDKEFFVVEYRKKAVAPGQANYDSTAYDAKIAGSGIIIYRVNETVTTNYAGAPYMVYVYRPGDSLDASGHEKADEGSVYLQNSYLSAESQRTTYGSANVAAGLSDNAITYSDGTNSGIVIKNVGSASGNQIQFDIEFSHEQSDSYWTTVACDSSAMYSLVGGTWDTISSKPADYAAFSKLVTFRGATYMSYQNTSNKACLAKYQAGGWTTVFTSDAAVTEVDAAADENGIAVIYNGESYNGMYCALYNGSGVSPTTVTAPTGKWMANPDVTMLGGFPWVVYREVQQSDRLVIKRCVGGTWTDVNSGFNSGNYALGSGGDRLYLGMKTGDGVRVYCYDTRAVAQGFTEVGSVVGGNASFDCYDMYVIDDVPYVACGTMSQLRVYKLENQLWSMLGNPVATGYIDYVQLLGQGNKLYATYTDTAERKNYVKQYTLSTSGGTGGTGGTGSTDGTEIVTPQKPVGTVSLSGSAHIQSFGDRQGTWSGNTLSMGTTGMSKRLEAITLNLKNTTGYSGSITYRVHRQTYGWTNWVSSGQQAGTTGQSKRLEAIQLQLTGELAKHYSIRYRVHIQSYGWNQGWQYDGALAGTTGEAKRLEALEIQIVPRQEVMGVTYRVHRQTFGWEKNWLTGGQVSGTTGQRKRLEGITIALTGNQYSGGIEYSTHVQTYGWMPYVSDGWMSGTSGQRKRLEGIRIRLTGEVADHYDIYYRVHAQTFGWLGWAKNGEMSGTSGLAKRLEAIQILLVPKGGAAPSSTYMGVTSNTARICVAR